MFNQTIWSMGPIDSGMADYEAWMAQPSVGYYNRPVVMTSGNIPVGSGSFVVTSEFQMQINKFVPGVGFVSTCEPSEGGNNRDFSGGNAPPPPDKREKDCMCGCDCNDIATMIQRQLAEQAALFEGVKDHIDRRVKEEITAHGKQLEAMSLDLQPMMDRLNQIESNLWNGIKQ